MVSIAQFDDAHWRPWQIQSFGTGLQALEKTLASESAAGTLCHGNAQTIADVFLASILAMTRLFKTDIPGIPTLTRIMEACKQREAFQKARPNVQARPPPGVIGGCTGDRAEHAPRHQQLTSTGRAKTAAPIH